MITKHWTMNRQGFVPPQLSITVSIFIFVEVGGEQYAIRGSSAYVLRYGEIWGPLHNDHVWDMVLSMATLYRVRL